MFDKIKKWIIGALTALVGLLFAILKIKNRKIENLKEKQKVAEVEITQNNKAVEKERETNVKVAEVEKKYSEYQNGYSELIEAWNDEKK